MTVENESIEVIDGEVIGVERPIVRVPAQLPADLAAELTELADAAREPTAQALFRSDACPDRSGSPGGYAVDDQTGINVLDSAVEVVSDRHRRLSDR